MWDYRRESNLLFQIWKLYNIDAVWFIGKRFLGTFKDLTEEILLIRLQLYSKLLVRIDSQFQNPEVLQNCYYTVISISLRYNSTIDMSQALFKKLYILWLDFDAVDVEFEKQLENHKARYHCYVRRSSKRTQFTKLQEYFKNNCSTECWWVRDITMYCISF